MGVLAVNRRVLEALFSDPVWKRRFLDAYSSGDVARVLLEFCKAKGFRVMVVEEEKKVAEGCPP